MTLEQTAHKLLELFWQYASHLERARKDYRNTDLWEEECWGANGKSYDQIFLDLEQQVTELDIKIPNGWSIVFEENVYEHTNGDRIYIDNGQYILWNHHTEDSEVVGELGINTAQDLMTYYNEGKYT